MIASAIADELTSFQQRHAVSAFRHPVNNTGFLELAKCPITGGKDSNANAKAYRSRHSLVGVYQALLVRLHFDRAAVDPPRSSSSGRDTFRRVSTGTVNMPRLSNRMAVNPPRRCPVRIAPLRRKLGNVARRLRQQTNFNDINSPQLWRFYSQYSLLPEKNNLVNEC
jgi:hypothetical protein